MARSGVGVCLRRAKHRTPIPHLYFNSWEPPLRDHTPTITTTTTATDYESVGKRMCSKKTQDRYQVGVSNRLEETEIQNIIRKLTLESSAKNSKLHLNAM